jgi:hypothetical protein
MFDDDRDDDDGYEDYDDVRGNNSDDEGDNNEDVNFEEKYDDGGEDESEFKAQFRDLERVGLDGPIGQELGANIENVKKKVRTKRERALEEMLKIQHGYENFSRDKKHKIQEMIVTIKGLEYYDLEILFSAVVYVFTNGNALTKALFSQHLKKFPLDIQRKKDDDDKNRKDLDDIVLLRYIRKIHENEKKRKS